MSQRELTQETKPPTFNLLGRQITELSTELASAHDTITKNLQSLVKEMAAYSLALQTRMDALHFTGNGLNPSDFSRQSKISDAVLKIDEARQFWKAVQS